jgi:hypothetical protein
MADSRDTLIGTDTTGAEYWLVPYNNVKAGNRKFEIRNSKKHVPQPLQGMWVGGDSAAKAFQAHMDAVKSSKKASSVKKSNES